MYTKYSLTAARTHARSSHQRRNLVRFFSWSLTLRTLRTLVIKKKSSPHDKPSRPKYNTTMRASLQTQPTLEPLSPTIPASWEDLANSVIASELVYKSVDVGQQAATALLHEYAASSFSPSTVTITDLAWSPPSTSQRYMLASSPSTLYVAFMGTKQPRDFVTNALCWQEAFLEDAFAAALGKLPGEASPTVHSGFRKRAASVPIMDIWKQARAAGKRLVLTGHSLGGSVAQVCTLSLLKHVPEAHTDDLLRCIVYATPAIGNAALKRAVEASGWDGLVTNISLPEDVVPHLLSWTPRSAAKRDDPSGSPVAQRRLMAALCSVLLPSLLPQASVAAALSATTPAITSPGWFGASARLLPLTAAIALPFVLPPGLLWGAGLFGCYAAIACLKSSIRLGPHHYYMIGRQYSLSTDGVLVPASRKAGLTSKDMTLWLHGCLGGHADKTVPVSWIRPRSLLRRVTWQYAMHRMPPLRTRLQAAQAVHDEELTALLCG